MTESKKVIEAFELIETLNSIEEDISEEESCEFVRLSRLLDELNEQEFVNLLELLKSLSRRTCWNQ